MRCKSLLPHVMLVLMLIGATVIIKAGATGRITGIITNNETGDPIIGASVQIVGTNRGAMTDFDGKFVVAQVEPGTYTVKITHLDYCAVEVTDVEVKSDLTFELLVSLEKKVNDIDVTISVTSAKDVIDKFNVSNQTMMTTNEVTIRGGQAGNATDQMDEGLPAPSQCYIKKEQRHPGFPPAHGGLAIVNGEAYDAMFFEHYGTNPFVDTEDDSLSTFAIDVDDASYIMTRSYLNRGSLPPKDAVRAEEFINHFDNGYDAPANKAFDVFLEGSPSRFGENCQLLRIGIKGREVRPEDRKPANLVFVIDVSGSMAREDRLTLVKKALRLLVDELTEEDKVGIVIYGSQGREILELTSIAHSERIIRAIEGLCTGGSTNAEEGIRLGYRMAERAFEKGKINRIILCSDGVANVGRTGAEDILKDIKRFAEQGITLTTVGFGMGNYNDVMMEKLGNKGNGHYAYVDALPEARRVFVENLTGTLQVIARDVKIQVDFNPEIVRSYRLIGYENRDVADNKFRDDKEDGGEIGSGHEVTALYEVKFQKRRRTTEPYDIGTVYVRWKDAENGDVAELNRAINGSVFKDSFDHCTTGFRLAASSAEFAEILRESYWAKGSDMGDLLKVVKGISMETESDDLIELMSLISKAKQLKDQLAEK